ncbi:hypothetical protein C882_2862 [Caenispirillum salinarum AK4]|uniref:Uncharacterized protein n=1 Tax=Caenispirillum salinarum AK4 TaxID=1238182 RepID=K9GNK2_9PROT|nr:hypothetical protein C882_2862 [Caenispirillum salinarum AK4]
MCRGPSGRRRRPSGGHAFGLAPMIVEFNGKGCDGVAAEEASAHIGALGKQTNLVHFFP